MTGGRDVGRAWLTLGAVGVVALAASAQGPAPGKSAAEQLALFRVHAPLLDQLLDQTLKLAEAGDALDRADRCRAAVASLSRALADAAAEPDADPSRVAELSGLLATVVRDGFGPALEQAGADHRPGSDGYPRLVEVRKQAGEVLATARAAFRGEGPASRSPQVRAARGELDAAVQGLPAAKE